MDLKELEKYDKGDCYGDEGDEIYDYLYYAAYGLIGIGREEIAKKVVACLDLCIVADLHYLTEYTDEEMLEQVSSHDIEVYERVTKTKFIPLGITDKIPGKRD